MHTKQPIRKVHAKPLAKSLALKPRSCTARKVKRTFSTTNETPAEPPSKPQEATKAQPELTPPIDLNASDVPQVNAKEVVATMNEQQQLVVRALFAESAQLRQKLTKSALLIDAQHYQNKILAMKLSEYEDEDDDAQRRTATMVDEHGRPKLASPFNDRFEVGEGNYRLGRKLGEDPTEQKETEKPTEDLLTDDITVDLTQKLIDIEHDPRVKTALIRERKLREQIQPMVNIIERAVDEKRNWIEKDKKKNILLLVTASLVAGQALVMYNADSVDMATVSALTNHNNVINSYLRESTDILETILTPKKNDSAATITTADPQTKWMALKEKMRLYNLSLTQQKNPSSQVDLAPVGASAESKTVLH